LLNSSSDSWGYLLSCFSVWCSECLQGMKRTDLLLETGCVTIMVMWAFFVGSLHCCV
jgi:hypothetical protein